MTDGARKILLTPDEHSVRSFLEVFVTLAIASLGGHSPPGVLQMTRKYPNDDDLVPTRYRLDGADVVEQMSATRSPILNPGLMSISKDDLSTPVCAAGDAAS